MSHELPAARPAGPPLRSITLLLLGGAVLIYGAFWAGPVMFYVSFQKRVAADGSGLLRRVPVASTTPALAGWATMDIDGSLIPLPPGEKEGIEREGRAIFAKLREGTITYQSFPRGFLRSLFLDELAAVGGGTGDVPGDVALLRDLSEATTDQYAFGLDERGRGRYGARILSKMLLWEPVPLRRFERADREEPRASAVLAQHEDGSVKIITTTDDATTVILVPAGAPPEWTSSPASWLPPARAGGAPTVELPPPPSSDEDGESAAAAANPATDEPR